jgi:3-hydroxyisobutyrate dehydrogenase-like beta-hydroxyacid dehydrogenase
MIHTLLKESASHMSHKAIKVGFIGLGRMGKPMAINVLKTGLDTIVYDLGEGPVGELTDLGARAAQSPKEAAEAADIVAIAFVDDAQVVDVLTGKGGVLEGAQPGTIIAVHSTIFPQTVQRMAAIGKARGVHIIDAPVSGGETGAWKKSLCYMVGGELAILDRCREVFATSASDIFHMGALGSGAATKMIVQVVTCINMLAAHEAELLAGRCGLDFAALQKVLHVSSAQSLVVDHWFDRFKLPQDPIETRRKRTEVFQKSLGPAVTMAQQLGLSLFGAELAERSLKRIMGIEES